MEKLLSSGANNITGNLFGSRLARQITGWVFFSIVTIEGIVFVPSYLRRETEELHKLETVSQEVLTTVKAEIMGDMPAESLLDRVQLNESSLIKGVAIYRAKDGQLVNSVGEQPGFAADLLTKPVSHPFWHFQMAQTPAEMSARHFRSEDGRRYDVAWPSQSSPYILAIRHDATLVQRGMRRYVFGVTCLVVIISAFVTLVTLLVLQRIVIRPLLLLRDDLSGVGEAIAQITSQSSSPIFASGQNIRPNELGEVATAFQGMYHRIHQEIRDRKEAEADLRLEQEKAERLLLNILPAEIAVQLKENEQNQGAIARRYESVTVLFADIVNFTNIAANTSPTQLVCQLNDIFSAFDAIAERHSLEKIKTIGDAYMVVGGVPTASENHAQAVMAMAIEMMEFARSYPMGDNHLGLRIGINTGPVVAGVIGTKKFSYDLWGDAVNIASRMESHGVINRIQVSEETYLRLKDNYNFEDRGYLLIKGRGEMQAFLLKQ